MPTVPRHFDACFAARWHRGLLARLSMPILLMHGSQTRTPARRVTELLSYALPHALRREVAGAGHLGPMTHESQVGDWMAQRIDPTLAQGFDRVAMVA
jgi:pimeloyl-ACP methyl ester carboxylesterase